MEALYSLKDDTSIIIKGADKGSVVAVWDRGDYLKKAYRQLDDKEEYEQVPTDPSTLDYFLVKHPKFARFYLLPKIHKRLHYVPGRPVTSNCSYYTKNISSVLDYHLQPLAHKVKLYIKYTNYLLSKLKNLGKLLKERFYVLLTLFVSILTFRIVKVRLLFKDFWNQEITNKSQVTPLQNLLK